MLRETDLGCGPGDGMSILDGQVRIQMKFFKNC